MVKKARPWICQLWKWLEIGEIVHLFSFSVNFQYNSVIKERNIGQVKY